MFVLFATILVGQKPQDVSGTILDGEGNRVVETTVLLLAEDGTEVQRTQTSKKRLGRGGGVFEFKKVAPGKYKIDIDNMSMPQFIAALIPFFDNSSVWQRFARCW